MRNLSTTKSSKMILNQKSRCLEKISLNEISEMTNTSKNQMIHIRQRSRGIKKPRTYKKKPRVKNLWQKLKKNARLIKAIKQKNCRKRNKVSILLPRLRIKKLKTRCELNRI